MQKRGQLKISFGMIFSIILIIVFVAFAFYAIHKFLEIQRTAQIARFIDYLQKDINKMWEGPQGSDEEPYFIPKRIKEVCFRRVDDSESEVEIYFLPSGSGETLDNTVIENVDARRLFSRTRTFCIEDLDGEVTIIIKKDFGETLVSLDKNG